MKRIFILIGCATLFIIALAHGQDQEIILQQPIASQTNTWAIDLFNKSGKPVSVSLKVSIQYDKQGTVIEFITQQISIQSIVSLPWRLLVAKYVKGSTIHSTFKDAYAGNKNLPLGNYRICLFLLNETSVVLTEDCQNFIVENIGLFPPLLIEPSRGDTILQNYPLFTWSPPGPVNNNNPSYEFFLYEIAKGQNPEGTVTKNQPYHHAKNVKESFYTYPTNALGLKENQAYAWQVIARVDDQILFSNIETFVLRKHKTAELSKADPKNVMYFQLNSEASNDFYNLTQPYLYFIYVNDNTDKALGYSILNSDGDVITEGKLEAAYGYNLLSLDLRSINLEKKAFGQLLVKKDQALTQQLLFLFNPEN